MCTKLFNLVLYNQTTWFYLPKYIILFLTQFCSPRVPGSAHPLIIDQGTNSSICHELGYSRQTTDYSVNCCGYVFLDIVLMLSCKDSRFTLGRYPGRTQQSSLLSSSNFLYKCLSVYAFVACNHMTLTNNYIYLT